MRRRGRYKKRSPGTLRGKVMRGRGWRRHCYELGLVERQRDRLGDRNVRGPCLSAFDDPILTVLLR